MTDPTLREEIEAVLAKATPEPWHSIYSALNLLDHALNLLRRASAALSDRDAEIARAVAEERAACVAIAETWVEVYGGTNPSYISPQKWAVNAVKYIAKAIRGRP